MPLPAHWPAKFQKAQRSFSRALVALNKKASPFALIGTGLVVLAVSFQTKSWLEGEVYEVNRSLENLCEFEEKSQESMERFKSIRDLKSQDTASFKESLLQVVQSKRGLYETGLMLQEEKRLLEKQWDLLITYLKLDGGAQRILIMRGEQPLESYPIVFGIPQNYGGPKKGLSNIVRIVSKERFAHPERGKAEKVGEEFLWNPPQVGESVRANALGEYVMFTDSDLVLHGPPTKLSEHEAFPHTCLALPLSTAKNLYQKSFIGTKIVVSPS